MKLCIILVGAVCCLEVCYAAVPSRDQSNGGLVIKLNKGIDFMLTVARWVFTKNSELSLALPDIDREFGSSAYKGQFTADGGTFRNIGSLHRTGDVAFSKVNSSLSLDVSLGLSELLASYTNYTFNILTIHQGGNMSLTVAENSLKMKLTFFYSPKCRFDLEEIQFDKLNGIKLDINGLGAFQMLYNELSKWLISNFEERFRIIANRKMHERLRDAVNKNTEMICKWWPRF